MTGASNGQINDASAPFATGGGGVTQILAGTNVTVSPSGGTGVVTVNATGGGGSPGGSQYEIQVNDGAGGFHGDNNLTWDYALGLFQLLGDFYTQGTGIFTDGTSALGGGELEIDRDNSDYANILGAGSHILLNNPDGAGQTVIYSYINGAMAAKWRTDYLGNISWVAGATGSHNFYVGGDVSDGGLNALNIYNDGNVAIGSGLSDDGSNALQVYGDSIAYGNFDAQTYSTNGTAGDSGTDALGNVFTNGLNTMVATAGVPGPYDMLSNFAMTQNNLTNPSATSLSVSTWNVITATSASSVKLPAPSAGKVIGIRIAPGSTKLLTLNPSGGGDNIDGFTSRIMWAGESAVLVSDGTNWNKVAGKTLPMSVLTYMYNGGSNLSVPNATNTIVLLDTVFFDNTGLMANTTSHGINILRNGNYQLGAAAGFSGVSPAAQRCIANVGLNSGSAPWLAQAEMYGALNGSPEPNFATTVSLTTSDFVQLSAYQNSGITQTLNVLAGSPAYNYIALTEIPSW